MPQNGGIDVTIDEELGPIAREGAVATIIFSVVIGAVAALACFLAGIVSSAVLLSTFATAAIIAWIVKWLWDQRHYKKVLRTFMGCLAIHASSGAGEA